MQRRINPSRAQATACTFRCGLLHPVVPSVPPLAWGASTLPQQQCVFYKQDSALINNLANLFSQEKYPSNKGEDFAATQSRISALYKAESEAVRMQYKQRADKLAGRDSKQQAEKVPKKLNGYSLFVKEKIPALKNQMGAQFNVPEAGKELGSIWKSLSEDQQQGYKDKAAAHNAAHGL